MESVSLGYRDLMAAIILGPLQWTPACPREDDVGQYHRPFGGLESMHTEAKLMLLRLPHQPSVEYHYVEPVEGLAHSYWPAPGVGSIKGAVRIK